MSCHTWSYRALKDSEFEKTRKSFLEMKMGSEFAHQACPEITEEEQADRICKEYEKIYKGRGEDISRDVVLSWIRNETECVRRLESCTTISDLADIIKNEDYFHETGEFKVVEDKIYVECGFDEPIRIYGYPEETFTDPRKFIKWVKEKEEKEGRTISEYYLGTKKQQGYTPQMETLIKKFWKKYDNEVYVEFG